MLLCRRCARKGLIVSLVRKGHGVLGAHAARMLDRDRVRFSTRAACSQDPMPLSRGAVADQENYCLHGVLLYPT